MISRTWCLVTALFIAVSVYGENEKVVTIDGMQFESSMISNAQKATDFLHFRFGKEDSTLGGVEQDVKHLTDNVPYAFRPLKDNSVWMLDSMNEKLKHFDAKGTLLQVIPLDKVSKGNPAEIIDFSFGAMGEIYLLCPRDKKVKVIDAKGTVKTEIGGFEAPLSLGSDAKGTVVVRDLQRCLLFHPDGSPAGRIDNPNLFPVFHTDGSLLGIKGNSQMAEIFRVSLDDPTREVGIIDIPLGIPPEKKVSFAGKEVLGVDDNGNILVELIAEDEDGVIHQDKIIKISPQGNNLGSVQILLKSRDFPCPSLPRLKTGTPDGQVMTFEATFQDYKLVTYRIP